MRIKRDGRCQLPADHHYHSLLILQVSPRLEAAVQVHGGMIRSSSQQDSRDKCYVLVVTDMQKADLGSAPPNMTNLHITTVDHVLVSPLCGPLRQMSFVRMLSDCHPMHVQHN